MLSVPPAQEEHSSQSAAQQEKCRRFGNLARRCDFAKFDLVNPK